MLKVSPAGAGRKSPVEGAISQRVKERVGAMNEQTDQFDEADDDILTSTTSDEVLEAAARGAQWWAYTDQLNFTRRGFCC